jgi:hypothetical protein
MKPYCGGSSRIFPNLKNNPRSNNSTAAEDLLISYLVKMQTIHFTRQQHIKMLTQRQAGHTENLVCFVTDVLTRTNLQNQNFNYTPWQQSRSYQTTSHLTSLIYIYTAEASYYDRCNTATNNYQYEFSKVWVPQNKFRPTDILKILSQRYNTH